MSGVAEQVAAAARRAGLGCEAFTLLRAAGNVVLADRSCGVAARVCASAHAGRAVSGHRCADAAARAGAPVLAPLACAPQRLNGGAVVTFWPLADPPGGVTAQQMADLAARLHAAALPRGRVRRLGPSGERRPQRR